MTYGYTELGTLLLNTIGVGIKTSDLGGKSTTMDSIVKRVLERE
ncbi:hypothetical protein [Oceanobacillus rekensis]|nr:hypothetical protein [Oceanobacillus rekensis]